MIKKVFIIVAILLFLFISLKLLIINNWSYTFVGTSEHWKAEAIIQSHSIDGYIENLKDNTISHIVYEATLDGLNGRGGNINDPKLLNQKKIKLFTDTQNRKIDK